MSYALAMSGEIRAWLAELAETDPPAAMTIGSALVALSAEGAALGPPVVVRPGGEALWSDPREALDFHGQDRLERLQAARREVSDAAKLASHLAAQIAALDAQRSQQADLHAAQLRQRLTEVNRNEQRLRERAQRMQAETDSLRARNEVLKARYTTAQAHLGIAETLSDVDLADDDRADGEPGPGGLTIRAGGGQGSRRRR